MDGLCNPILMIFDNHTMCRSKTASMPNCGYELQGCHRTTSHLKRLHLKIPPLSLSLNIYLSLFIYTYDSQMHEAPTTMRSEDS